MSDYPQPGSIPVTRGHYQAESTAGAIQDLLQMARERPEAGLQGAASIDQLAFVADVLRPLRVAIDDFNVKAVQGLANHADWGVLAGSLRTALRECEELIPPEVVVVQADDPDGG